ncbi:MAG: thioredoxin domain-containing protein [Acidimicrobiales bacterium]
MNRLAGETSPYLRQHKDNPVDWYPWGEDALAEAKRRDVPLLVSIGYSSCHWCHVMAHESFEDPATAEVVNAGFLPVKVDREERPDVDALYMEAIQALTGQGGWPLTAFCTPDGAPFYGGTYFPAVERHGMPSFKSVLAAVSDAWAERKSQVLAQAGQLTEAIRAGVESTDHPALGEGASSWVDAGLAELRATFDEKWGGFARAPKFPRAPCLELLATAVAIDGPGSSRGAPALRELTRTLDQMARGGIYDHLGGGFSRYSTDERWLVPHFEKMLYDQAMLGRAYLHGYQLTGNPEYLQVLEETIGYIARDLRGAGGGYCSSQDADSAGFDGLPRGEGRYYTWTPTQLAEALGPDLARQAMARYRVTRRGNFEGASILHLSPAAPLARSRSEEEIRERLLEARTGRPAPGLDDKVLTEWNAMTCSLLAEAGAALGRADWLERAEELAAFLLEHLKRPDGRWLRSFQAGRGSFQAGRGSFQAGRARYLAYSSDYAWLVDAFTRLAEATGRARYVEEATATAEAMTRLFSSPGSPLLFTAGADAEPLSARTRDLFDSSAPSANAVAASALWRLHGLTGRRAYEEAAEGIASSLGALSVRYPTGSSHALSTLLALSAGTVEIVVAGDRPDLVRVASSAYLPNAVRSHGEPFASPIWEARAPGHGYVCRQWACLAPAGTPDQLLERLAAVVTDTARPPWLEITRPGGRSGRLDAGS